MFYGGSSAQERAGLSSVSALQREKNHWMASRQLQKKFSTWGKDYALTQSTTSGTIPHFHQRSGLSRIGWCKLTTERQLLGQNQHQLQHQKVNNSKGFEVSYYNHEYYMLCIFNHFNNFYFMHILSSLRSQAVKNPPQADKQEHK